MDAFSKPRFAQQIAPLADAYGGLSFWTENLNSIVNPDATWRALLLIGCIRPDGLEEPVRNLLTHHDSRVRAWACFALGQLADEASLEQIRAMNADPSNRVRIHAWQAVQAMVGEQESARVFPIRIPPRDRPILISEDSRVSQASIAARLGSMGYPVLTASTEAETIALAVRVRPHAIVTDNQKGADNLSGLNLTWQLSRMQELRETVVFMVTADAVEPFFLWSGGDYFLPKASNALTDLAKVVNEYLHH